jgi:copper chaperone CopZ
MMKTLNKQGQMRCIVLPLYHLGCSSGDSLIVERILARQPGVIRVYANPAAEKAYIEYDPALTDKNRLEGVIQRAGYGPTTERKVENREMSCHSRSQKW